MVDYSSCIKRGHFQKTNPIIAAFPNNIPIYFSQFPSHIIEYKTILCFSFLYVWQRWLKDSMQSVLILYEKSRVSYVSKLMWVSFLVFLWMCFKCCRNSQVLAKCSDVGWCKYTKATEIHIVGLRQPGIQNGPSLILELKWSGKCCFSVV